MKKGLIVTGILLVSLSFAVYAETVSEQLFKAAVNGDNITVSKLVLNGADINVSNSSGFSPLLTAVYSGHTDIAGILISNGASVDGITRSGLTPLLLAAIRGNTDMVKFLLKSGAAVDKPGHTGFTPLLAAVLSEHQDTAVFLIESGADVDYKLPSGYTPLMVAVIKESNSLRAYMDKEGITDITFDTAVGSGYFKMVKALVANGADADAVDNAGGTAALYAGYFGFEMAADYIKENSISGE